MSRFGEECDPHHDLERGWRWRNQWTGKPRCGMTLQSGKNKGQPCSRIASYISADKRRLICKRHKLQEATDGE